jgi:tellurite resistance protein
MNYARIERLRERLLGQGSPTMAPPPPSPGHALLQKPPESQRPEDLAIYERLRPFAEAVYLVVSADRAVSERERDALRGALRILTDGALSSAALHAMIDGFDRTLARDGCEQRLDTVASELYGDIADHELALALAAAAATADGDLDDAERTTLESLAERLGVSRAQLETLLG